MSDIEIEITDAVYVPLRREGDLENHFQYTFVIQILGIRLSLPILVMEYEASDIDRGRELAILKFQTLMGAIYRKSKVIS